jgi:predicted RNA-binding protein with RPS1 domain
VKKQFEVTRLKKRKRNFEKMLRKFLRESDEKQKNLKKRREKRK